MHRVKKSTFVGSRYGLLFFSSVWINVHISLSLSLGGGIGRGLGEVDNGAGEKKTRPNALAYDTISEVVGEPSWSQRLFNYFSFSLIFFIGKMVCLL